MAAAAVGLTALFDAAASPVHAQAAGASGRIELYRAALANLTMQEITGLALTLGLLCFAVVTAIALVRTRAQATRREHLFRDEILALRGDVERVHALLMAEPQILIAWPTPAGAAGQPTILGELTLVADGNGTIRPLAFGTWLEAKAAQRLEAAVETLRAAGRGFVMPLTTLAGRQIEAEGRAIADCAVLRLKDVSGVKLNLLELTAKYDKLNTNVETLHHLIDALPSPIWARDAAGHLVFANAAYGRAVEARDGADAVARGLELLDRSAREDLARLRAGGAAFSGRLPAIAAGARRNFDVVDVPGPLGSAGIAVDATETEMLRVELRRTTEAHRRTLDQLATGVAIYSADQTLVFYNAAFQTLWDLDAGFLDQGPSDSAVLERLRAAHRLPEEQDFRQWKAQLHDAYRAIEPKEQMWHLPDGRALRVITTPNPEGGVTYVFEDVTERLELARRYDALIKVQSETLDHFAEAVAVFGSDGRIRLHNPAFATMWRLQPTALAEHPHVEAVIAWCQAQYDDGSLWRAIRTAVTSIDQREPMSGTLERRDGSVLVCASLPLPDGATMVTFRDVTDTVNVERALRERNDALEAADRIKVSFVQHVSYELRSPLTNIIGFAHFLGDPAFGPLTDKQREYLGYMTASTNALLALINNILDLATIDAGAMTLNLGPVDIRATMEAAAEGIQDRLVSQNLRLDIRAAADIGSFEADSRRVRQVLFNLLSNAAGFSSPGGTITLSAERGDEAVVFTVRDHGAGIPAQVQDKVFEWFESHSNGSDHRGSGLGLSLVRSFVALHGGSVTLNSAVGSGTVVTCTFPLARGSGTDSGAARSAA
ncbi:MAG TPA: PAS-domain containing protein [Pseudolabrys sp.]|nr:PAS-domain containing protein [Pseudolabrys sp.]